MKNSSLRHVIIFTLIILSATVLFNSKRRTNPYYYDEVSWTCEGRVFPALIKGDFKSGVWVEDLVQRLNPQIGKYVLGGWMLGTLGIEGFDVFSCPSWGHLMHISGLEKLSPMQQETLFTMRIPMMLFGAYTLGILYLITVVLKRPALGILTALLLMINPLYQETINRAMPDSLLMFWTTLILLYIAWISVKDEYFYRRIIPSLILGISLGIAVSIKTYGLYLFGLILALWGWRYLKNVLQRKEKIFYAGVKTTTQLILIALIAVVTVFLCNPVFIKEPKLYASWIPEWTTFQHWLQTDDWAYKDIALLTPKSRILAIYKVFFTLKDVRIQSVHQVMSIVFLIIGLFYFLRHARKDMRGEVFFIFYFLVYLLILLLYTPFFVSRYFTPLLIPYILIVSQGILTTTSIIVKRIRRGK